MNQIVAYTPTAMTLLPAYVGSNSGRSASVDLAAPAADAVIHDSLEMGNILLVEDNDLVSQSVLLKLERLGYTVTAVATPARALAILETNADIDLVFTDVMLPGAMTGADLAREVQHRWPAVKVLATSGYPASMMPDNIKLPEGVRLLAKPYRNADFARTLREVIEGQG